MLSMFENQLLEIDAQMSTNTSPNIPRLFRMIPLDVFGKLLLDIPPQFPHLKAYFPSMASKDVQMHWTGAHGETLLNQSLAFIKMMIYGYASISGKGIENASVLDFGCGWGRLIRLLYKFVPVDNIFGCDPFNESIKICKEAGIRCNLAISDYVPRDLPFERKFDLIFAFSVFTHLSEKTVKVVLNTLRQYISDTGVLVITVRPKEYWQVHERVHSQDAINASKMVALHEKKGFAFHPHNLPPVEGDVTYGDASISIEYFDENFPQWKLVAVEYNDLDPYQIVLFFTPC